MSRLFKFRPPGWPTRGAVAWSLIAILSLSLAGGFAIRGSFGADAKATKTSSNAATKSFPATDTEVPDDLDAEVDVDLSALVVPTRLFTRPPRATDRLKFSQELRGLLQEGFKDKGVGLDAAKKHFETARRLVPDDPRAPYAYGLALLSQNRSIVALEHFHAAAKQKEVPFLPAWQGIAWMHLSRGDYAQGLPALLELARRLEESHDSWPAAEDKEHSAEWLGRMVGFLEGPGKTTEQSAAIAKFSADVAKLLTGERKVACERGRQEVIRRYDEFQSSAALPAAELLAEATQQREKISAALVAAESDVKKLEAELKGLRKPHDNLLTDLSHEIHSNATKIKSATAKLDAAEAEVDEFSSPKLHPQLKSQGMRRPGKVVPRNENAGEKKIRESQLASAQKALDRLKSTIEEARQGIARARKQRDDEQVEFRKSTAGKRQALHAAQHQSTELSAAARIAEHGAPTPEKLKARATALDSYVSLYPDLEKGRLLATLETP